MSDQPVQARIASERITERLERLRAAVDGRTTEGKWVQGLQDVVLRSLRDVVGAYDEELEKAAQKATRDAKRAENAHASEVEALKRNHAMQVERLTRERDGYQRDAESSYQAMKQMRADNEIAFTETGRHVEVVPPKNRYGRSSAWTVEVLEESTMRLRLAGAGDKTPVDVGHRKLEADVREPLPPSAEEISEQEAEAARLKRARRRDLVRVTAAWTGTAVIGVPVLLGVWWVIKVVYGFMFGLAGL